MIIVVTNCDEATASNAAVCQHLHADDGAQLWGEAAVRQGVVGLAGAIHGDTMLLVGHGSENEFLGNDGTAALTMADTQILAGRTTIAIACKTGSLLGRQVANDGGTWCGFEGAISCLLSDEDVVHHFRAIPDFFVANAELLAQEATAISFVEQFTALISHIIAELEHMDDTPRIEPFVAARLFRERLRVWLPAQQQALEPVGATRPSVF